MRCAFIAVLALVASPAFAGDYATCLLDKLPGVANDVAARAIVQVCVSENPGGMLAVPQGSGRGFFGYKSGAECAAKKASDTRSEVAAGLIWAACRKLYEEPVKLVPFHGKLDGER